MATPAEDRVIYARPLRTRGTDCGPDWWVGLPTVIRYFEHCRWEWLRLPALGLATAVHGGHGFYVTEQEIALSRRFGQGIDAQVRGALRRIGRVEARADQDLVRHDGVLLAHCRIRGVWVGPNGRMTRIPRSARAGVTAVPLASTRGEDEPGTPSSLFDPPSPLRSGALDLVPPPVPDDAHVRTVVVRSSDIDVFSHVNASNYVKFLADSLAIQGASPSVHRASLRYVGQARAGDAVDVRTAQIDETHWVGVVQRREEVLFRAVVETEAS